MSSEIFKKAISHITPEEREAKVKELETLSQNVTIAEYMGFTGTHYRLHPPVDLKPYPKTIYVGTNIPNSLKFHKEWNWLMPVWKKLRADMKETIDKFIESSEHSNISPTLTRQELLHKIIECSAAVEVVNIEEAHTRIANTITWLAKFKTETNP